MVDDSEAPRPGLLVGLQERPVDGLKMWETAKSDRKTFERTVQDQRPAGRPLLRSAWVVESSVGDRGLTVGLELCACNGRQGTR